MQHAAPNLIFLDRFKQRLEVAVAKTVVALALNEFEEDRADGIGREDLQQHLGLAAIDHAFAVDETTGLAYQLMSFGFKRGVPVDADLVFDVRFLPNPFWVPELRPKTGLSPDVSSYVLAQPGAVDFVAGVDQLLTGMEDGYLREGKKQVTVAIGCTGGKHRSTAITEELAARLRSRGRRTAVLHRDLGRE